MQSIILTYVWLSLVALSVCGKLELKKTVKAVKKSTDDAALERVAQLEAQLSEVQTKLQTKADELRSRVETAEKFMYAIKPTKEPACTFHAWENGNFGHACAANRGVGSCLCRYTKDESSYLVNGAWTGGAGGTCRCGTDNEDVYGKFYGVYASCCVMMTV